MGEKNAYLVECQRMYGTRKRVILAPSIEEVMAVLKRQMKFYKMEGCAIESIVLVGEVLNG